MVPYKIHFKSYSENGNIDFDDNTNEITFVNKGTSIVTINNTFPLSANDSLSIGGNLGEVDKSVYVVGFEAGGENLLIVISKTYGKY